MSKTDDINAIAAEAYRLSATGTTALERAAPLRAASDQLEDMTGLNSKTNRHRNKIKSRINAAKSGVMMAAFVVALNELAEGLQELGVSVQAANAYADNMPLVKIANNLKSFTGIVESADLVKDSLVTLSKIDTSDKPATTAGIDAAANAISALQENLADLLEPESNGDQA